MRRSVAGRVLGLAVAGLLLLAPVALAAPPANDDFAGAEALGSALSIALTRTNAEATKEAGESVDTFAAGHSVWFEWEATNTGFVTVGSCEGAFRTVLGVFTGASVNSLTRVASGNSSEGPHCPFEGRELTFKATSGTTYKIAVDGNAFSFGPPPVTEGEFTLRIEATPAPANDDFADATTLITHFEEEFEGEAFYFGSQFGYNWNATLESGEPNPLGGPIGASVWYSWTAPVSGEAKISTCCALAPRLSMYTGESLEALDLHFGGIGSGGFATFPARAGTTYRLVVYGLLDELSGETEVGSFELHISLRAPLPASTGSGRQTVPTPPPPDTAPPGTTIHRRVLKRVPPIWIFSFESNEPDSAFRCKLDRHRFAKCRSTKRFEHLKPGSHTLKVIAVDPAGNADPSPATAHFTVPDDAKAHSRH